MVYICYLKTTFFAEGLQKQITALYSYASLLHIIVSIPKTKFVIFIERYTTVCGSSHCCDNIIEKAEQYKYLGSSSSNKSLLYVTFWHKWSFK